MRRRVGAVGALALLAALLPGPAAHSQTEPTVRLVVADDVREGATLGVAVVLSAVTGHDVTVRVDTREGAALAPQDYRGVHQTVTVPAGSREARLRLRTVEDALDEGAESLEVRLRRPDGAELASRRSRATVRILDDDPMPTASVVAATLTEPGFGHRLGFTQVRLSAVSGRRVVVELLTEDGTATGGQDFVRLRPVAVFAPGTRQATVSVELLADGLAERTETLRLVVTSVRHATATRGATISILDAAGDRVR